MHTPYNALMIRFLLTLQAAFVAFTRLPLASRHLQEQHFRQAHYFLPVVGAAVSLGMALTYWLCVQQLSPHASVFFALLAGILLTGALHEDGFADCCDGFGGGQDKEQILLIMKDSRLGTYGVVGLVMLLLAKLVLLQEIPYTHHLLALLTMPVMARITPLLLMATLPRLQHDNAKMTQGLNIEPIPLCISLLFAVACMQTLHPPGLVAYLAALIVIIALAARWYLAQRLQGYNGDCLGAVEQLGECAVLLMLALYY